MRTMASANKCAGGVKLPPRGPCLQCGATAGDPCPKGLAIERTKFNDVLGALKRIAEPHTCGCKPCTGQCVSQEALQITLDEIRDFACAAVAKAEAAP